MRYVIDEKICEKYGVSVDELLYMLHLEVKKNIKLDLDNDFIVTVNGLSRLTDKGNELVRKILLESDSSVPEGNDLDELVIKMQNLFPKGKKEGTKLYWRGNHKEIKTRLQVFFKYFGNKYSYDDIYDATKRYVEYHNGNYSYMRILKYFIMKNITFKTEEKGFMETVSELATFIENKGQEDTYRSNFDVTLV